MSTGTKLLGYLTRRLTSTALVIILLFMSVTIAYNCANIYVILEEGMDTRAEAVLTGEEVSHLDKFFTQHCINNDSLLNSSIYDDYLISEYDYKMKLKKVWAWPWSKRATATIQEIMSDISGDLKVREDFEEDEEESVSIPEWENGEKIVKLKKIKHRWMIDEINTEKSLEDLD